MHRNQLLILVWATERTVDIKLRDRTVCEYVHANFCSILPVLTSVFQTPDNKTTADGIGYAIC